jgi:hypothetical protein
MEVNDLQSHTGSIVCPVMPRPLAALDPQSLETGSETREASQTTSIDLSHDVRMTVLSLSTSNPLHVADPRTRSPDAELPPKRRGRRQLLAKRNNLKCHECEDEVTFSRMSDVDRHHRLKHSHGYHQHFVCNAQGCFKGQVPWSFARSDKLTSHIKTTHNPDTIFSRCPIKGCTFGPCALEVLGVHVQRAHQDHEAGRAVLNATSCKALRCPKWRCGKHVSAKKLLHHVASHAKEDVEAAKPNLELLGLLIQSTPGYGFTIQVVCPICHAVSADIEKFTGHLVTSHLYTPESGGSEHFDNWKACLARNMPKYAIVRHAVAGLLPWSHLRTHKEYSGSFGCPSCPFSVAGFEGYGLDQEDKRRAIREHHLGLLRPEAEVVKDLYPHRMQILRLWPEFVTHPVFADLDHPQQQIESGPSGVQPSSASYVNNDLEIPYWIAHTSNQPQQDHPEAQPSLLRARQR